MTAYPSFRYHPTKGAELVTSEAEELELGEGWFHSPADFGVETCPSKKPDPVIAARAEAFKAAQEAKRPGRPKKIEPKEGVSA